MIQDIIHKKYTKTKTKKIVDRLLEINNETELTAERLVKEAKSPKSIFHDLFEWNDSKAGHLYRLVQARNIINSINIIVENKETRAFENIGIDGKNSYKPIYEVLDNQEFREQVIKKALNEINYWKTKYENYSEFKPIVKGIKVVSSRLRLFSGSGKAHRVGARS